MTVHTESAKNGDDQTLGPLEIKKTITQKQCIRNICGLGVLTLLLLYMMLLKPYIGFRDNFTNFLFILSLGGAAYSWVRTLSRVRREGPIETMTPNLNATPEQRAFERQTREITVAAAVLFMALATAVIFLGLDTKAGPSGLAALMAVTGISALLVGMRRDSRRKQLAADAALRIKAAEQSMPRTATVVSGSGHWWTQSAMREETDSVKVGR